MVMMMVYSDRNCCRGGIRLLASRCVLPSSEFGSQLKSCRIGYDDNPGDDDDEEEDNDDDAIMKVFGRGHSQI